MDVKTVLCVYRDIEYIAKVEYQVDGTVKEPKEIDLQQFTFYRIPKR